MREDGSKDETVEEIQSEAERFYKRLLDSSSMNFSRHSLLFEIITKSITAEDCALLAAQVTPEEIKRVNFLHSW